MKKSIVLLLTLLFVASLSALILKNLEDTEVYVQEQNSKINNIQVLYLLKNFQREISKVVEKIPDTIPKEIIKEKLKLFTNVPLPPIVDNQILIKYIKIYDKININDLKNKDKNKKNIVKEKLNELEIYNVDNLSYLLKENDIISHKQLDSILRQFAKENYDDKILNPKVKEKIGFFDSTQRYYELEIMIKTLNKITSAYYILDNKGKVKYFELSFK